MEEAMNKIHLLQIIAIVFFISCEKNNSSQNIDVPNNNNSQSETSDINKINNPINDIILNFDVTNNLSNDNIVFLEKINLGITDGDNWLVAWEDIDFKDLRVKIYIIKNDQIVKIYNPNIYLTVYEDVLFDMMQEIPGQRILGRYGSIGDYNNDGYDEILAMVTSGTGENLFIIKGYDAEEDEIIDLCKLAFKIINIDNGPSPIKFIQYKGKEGFQIYLEDHYDRDTAYWGFVSWSAITGQYEIEEYEPE
jgi:hypothetical protein